MARALSPEGSRRHVQLFYIYGAPNILFDTNPRFYDFSKQYLSFGVFLGREHKREPGERLNLTSPFEVAPRYPFYSMIS